MKKLFTLSFLFLFFASESTYAASAGAAAAAGAGAGALQSAASAIANKGTAIQPNSGLTSTTQSNVAVLKKNAAFSWQGLYLGVNVGYHHDINTQKYTGDSFITGTLVPSNAPALSRSTVGAVAGITGGYDYQINQYILGVVGDWEKLTGDGPASYFYNTHNSQNSEISKSNVYWLAMLMGRAGVATKNYLFYITGGPTVGSIRATNTLTMSTTPPGAVPINWYGKKNVYLTGGCIGGGIEKYLTGNWSVKAEYLYYNLGNTVVPQTDVSSNHNTNFVDDKVTFRGQVITLGFIYRFI